MGYDLHITRREDWSDDTDAAISLEEWVSLVAKDPDLQPDAENPTPDNAIFLGATEPWPLWWYRGEIRTKNPTREVIVKMVGIGRALEARVQGDDGEIYGIDPANPWKSNQA